MRNSYAVLIPTKTRPNSLIRLFKSCPELNSKDTYIGIEPEEEDLYADWRNGYGDKCMVVPIENPEGMPSAPREQLKRWAQDSGGYKRVVLIDDNCVIKSHTIPVLLHAAEQNKGSVVAGVQPISSFFHKNRIEKGVPYNSPWGTYRLFPVLLAVVWTIPTKLYYEHIYPDGSCLDDMHFIVWAMTRKGFCDFYGCDKAEYKKSRFELGGSGEPNERLIKICKSMINMAETYPEVTDYSWIVTRAPLMNMLKELRARNGKN